MAQIVFTVLGLLDIVPFKLGAAAPAIRVARSLAKLDISRAVFLDSTAASFDALSWTHLLPSLRTLATRSMTVAAAASQSEIICLGGMLTDPRRVLALCLSRGR